MKDYEVLFNYDGIICRKKVQAPDSLMARKEAVYRIIEGLYTTPANLLYMFRLPSKDLLTSYLREIYNIKIIYCKVL